jgi:uncharacterized membrane protein
MVRPLGTYLVTGVAMLAIDAVWLSLMAEPFYRVRIGHLLRDADFDVSAAAAFYFLYLLGILVLVQMPSRRWQGAAWRGAVFGLCAYGTYDLTNQATLKDWPWTVTFVDLAWGSSLTAVVAAIGFRLVAPHTPADTRAT